MFVEYGGCSTLWPTMHQDRDMIWEKNHDRSTVGGGFVELGDSADGDG